MCIDDIKGIFLIYTGNFSEVHEKVNKLETEIFKEIEERDKEEQSETKEPTDANINTRLNVFELTFTSKVNAISNGIYPAGGSVV